MKNKSEDYQSHIVQTILSGIILVDQASELKKCAGSFIQGSVNLCKTLLGVYEVLEHT